MIRQCIADARLLRRSLVYATYLVVALIGVLTCWISRRSAGRQFEIITNGLQASGLNPAAGACDVIHRNLDMMGCLSQPLASGIDPAFPRSLLGYVPYVNGAADEMSPLGLLTFAGRHGASMVGIMAVVLLVTLHVTSTWDTGVARRLLPLIGWRRYLTQKVVAVATIVAPIPLTLWIGALIAKVIPVGQSLPVGSASLGQGVRTMGLAYVVLIIVGALTTGIAVIARNLVLGFIVTTGVLALSFFGTLDPDLYGYSPAGWVAVLMEFPEGSYRQVVDYLWVPGTSGHSTLTAIVGLTSLAFISLAAGAAFLSRVRKLA